MRQTISWLVTVASGSNTITVTLDGVAEVLTIAAGDYRGWQTTAGGGAEAGTLARALETALLTHSRAVTCEVSYDYSATAGSPRLQVDITTTGPRTAGDGIVWTSADPLVWGWSGSATWGTATTVYAEHNGDGYWCPGETGVRSTPGDNRTRYAVGGVALPEHAPEDGAVSLRTWGYGHRVAITYPYVEAAYVHRYRAADSTFATRAGRDASDPNNTLEGLFAAASSGDDVEMRYHYADGSTRDDGVGGGSWYGVVIRDWDMASALSDAQDGLGSYGVTIAGQLVRA